MVEIPQYLPLGMACCAGCNACYLCSVCLWDSPLIPDAEAFGALLALNIVA